MPVKKIFTSALHRRQAKYGRTPAYLQFKRSERRCAIYPLDDGASYRLIIASIVKPLTTNVIESHPPADMSTRLLHDLVPVDVRQEAQAESEIKRNHT